MSSSLSHSNSVVMNREQIAQLQTPAPMGRFHKPIPHIEIIDTILRVFDENRLDVVTSKFAVNEKTADIFGTFDLQGETVLDRPDLTTSLGFRSNNMQKRPVAFVAGARVFVCDNLMFFGDFEVLKHKHTIHFNLLTQIRDGIEKFLDQAFVNTAEVDRLKSREISDVEAKTFVFDTFAEKVFPVKCFDDVVAEYWAETPRHESFAARTAWSLVNSFTEVAKTLRVNPRTEALSGLGRRQKTLL